MNINENLHVGMQLQLNGQIDEARQIYESILRLDPRNANAHHLLGCIFKGLGQCDEGIASISTAIDIAPQHAMFFNNLGACYQEKKEFIVAEMCFERALALDPQNIDAICNLTRLFEQVNKNERALQLIESAMQFAPNHPHILTVASNLCLGMLRFESALQFAERALAQKPEDMQAQLARVNALSRLNRNQEALIALEAFASTPSSLPLNVLVQKAGFEETLGKLDDACKTYDIAISLYPKEVGLLAARTQLQKVKENDIAFQQLQHIRDSGKVLIGATKTQFHYALGKGYQDTGVMEQAARHYALGAANVLQLVDYDPSVDQKLCEVFIQCFNKDFFQTIEGQGSTSESPIFVVGMSRSGTTLVEQILASHPQVQPAGELTLISEASDGIVLPGGWTLNKTSENKLPREANLLERANYYLAQVKRLTGGVDKPHVTDKMPENYLNIGLIHAMFPKARIIHCRRDPIDTCISNYVTLFATKHYWSYDFNTLAATYRNYWRIMQHWREVLPGRCLELRYEQVVANTEAEAKRLLAWCDLPWDERVLRFYETDRSVNTASVTQVRQPIYSSSAGRWKKWAPYIEPLTTGLAEIEQSYWAELENKV